MTDRDRAPVPGWRGWRWLGLVVVLSLAANVGGAGFLAGLALRRGGEVREPAVTLSAAIRGGAPELRRAARAAFAERRDDYAALRRAAAEAQASVAAAARAEPFDPEDFAGGSSGCARRRPRSSSCATTSCAAWWWPRPRPRAPIWPSG